MITSFPVAVGCGRRRLFPQGFRPSWAANAPGITDTEIKIGQTMPYGGPASRLSTRSAGRKSAYFKMINEHRRGERPQTRSDQP